MTNTPATHNEAVENKALFKKGDTVIFTTYVSRDATNVIPSNLELPPKLGELLTVDFVFDGPYSHDVWYRAVSSTQSLYEVPEYCLQPVMVQQCTAAMFSIIYDTYSNYTDRPDGALTDDMVDKAILFLRNMRDGLTVIQAGRAVDTYVTEQLHVFETIRAAREFKF